MPTSKGGDSHFGYTADLQVDDSWSSSSKTYKINGSAKCSATILKKSFSITNGYGYFSASGKSGSVRVVHSLQAFGKTISSNDTTHTGVSISASSTPFVISKPSLVSAVYTIGFVPCTLTAGVSGSLRFNASASWRVLPSSGSPNFSGSIGPAADIAVLTGSVVGHDKLLSAGFAGSLTLIKSELLATSKAFWSASNSSVLPQAQYAVNWKNTTLNGTLQAKIKTLNRELFSLTLAKWSGYSKTTSLKSGTWKF